MSVGESVFWPLSVFGSLVDPFVDDDGGHASPACRECPRYAKKKPHYTRWKAVHAAADRAALIAETRGKP